MVRNYDYCNGCMNELLGCSVPFFIAPCNLCAEAGGSSSKLCASMVAVEIPTLDSSPLLQQSRPGVSFTCTHSVGILLQLTDTFLIIWNTRGTTRH